jgi:hypothetical protein
LWASFVLALPFWSRRLALWFGGENYTRGLCTVALLLSVSSYGLWFFPAQYTRAPSDQARREAVQSVPLDATVLCPENMLAHFVRHPALNSLGELRYYGGEANQLFDYEYVVFDGNYWAPEWKGQQEFFDLISKLPTYRLVFARDNVFVYKRVGAPRHAPHS